MRMKLLGSAVLFFALAGFAEAQITGASNIVTGSGGTSITTGGSFSNAVFTWNNSTCWMTTNGTQCVPSGNSSDTIYNVPYETRKDDGHGPTIRIIKSSARPIMQSALAPSEYLARAIRIGLESAGTDEARTLQAIHDVGLHVYDYDHVDNYLYRQALHLGAKYRWVWEPLREKDTKAVASGNTTAGYIYNVQYSREVPDRILADVERLIDCAPSDAMFLVSDFKAVNPDPFLAITTPRMLAAGRIFIVDQWDEPGFREKEVVELGTIALK